MDQTTGLCQRMKLAYGQNIFNITKIWFNTNTKLASYKNRRIFLLRCKSGDIFPNHICNNFNCLYSISLEAHPYRNNLDTLAHQFKLKLLKIEIKITNWKIRKLQQENLVQEERLKEALSPIDFINISKKCHEIYEKAFQKVKSINIKKLQLLLKKGNSNQTHNDNSHEIDQKPAIFNFTNVTLPEEVENTLNFSPKVGLNPRTTPKLILDLIKDTEYAIQMLPSDEDSKNTIRCEAINKIMNFLNNKNGTTRDRRRQVITWKQFRTTQKFLKEHNDIMIAKADKGGATVIMYKTEYEREMSKMLSDTNTYKHMKRDPTNRLMKTANKYLKELEQEATITTGEYKKFKSNNCQPPRIYGLRKTHKTGLHLRPVVSNIDSPSYAIAKLLHNMLLPVTTTFLFNVKNSFEFVNLVRNVTVPKDFIFLSLDVTSLFTNIPRNLVIEIFMNNWSFISNYINISKSLFLNIVNFCFDSSYFKYKDNCYQQLDGTAMGNPASPVLAAFVMNFLMTSLVELLPFELAFLKVYVDDTFIIAPENEVQTILNTINNIHPKLTFTIELEENCKLPFLDVIIIRDKNSGKISTDLYRKPTSVDRTLDFKSNHTLCQKINIIQNDIYRIYYLCDRVFDDKNVSWLLQKLKRNNYPVLLSKKIIRKTFQRFESLNGERVGTFDDELTNNRNGVDLTLTDRPEEKIYVRFPLITGLSSSIKQLFKNTNVILSFYNTVRISDLYTKLKDPVPLCRKTNTIYSIPCITCQNKYYIGQSKQYLTDRIKQHKQNCKIININKKEQTALSHHHFSNRHEFDFENFKILATEYNWRKRNFCEMVFIKITNNINYRTDTENLSTTYAGVLNWLKRTGLGSE